MDIVSKSVKILGEKMNSSFKLIVSYLTYLQEIKETFGRLGGERWNIKVE
jgi:hypothetical protein